MEAIIVGLFCIFGLLVVSLFVHVSLWWWRMPREERERLEKQNPDGWQ